MDDIFRVKVSNTIGNVTNLEITMKREIFGEDEDNYNHYFRFRWSTLQVLSCDAMTIPINNQRWSIIHKRDLVKFGNERAV